MTLRILVTDADQRAALAVTRSLGRAGYEVHVVGPAASTLAGSSRHAARQTEVPNALEAPEKYVEAVSSVIHSGGIDLLIPITEASLLSLLPAWDRWPHVKVPCPDADKFARISDKAGLLAAARDVGMAVPGGVTLVAKTVDGFAQAAALQFPLVLKPSRSVRELGATRAKLAVGHAFDIAALERSWAALGDEAFPLLVQERIVGPGTGLFLLRWDGQTRAVFAHRRIREKPPAGGVSVYSESVPADSALVARAEALLDRYDWRGVAMVEFKRDLATGTLYLMEINGRFWGSLQLAIDAGVDFPALLVAAARGAPFTASPPFRVGARCRWLWGDVDHLITRLRHSDGALNLPPGSPSRLRTVADIVLPWRSPGRNEVWRWNDPGPALYETRQWFRSLR